MSEEVRLRELIAQKETQIGQLQADNQQLRTENKLLREKVDLLIKKIFGSQSEKLDAAQLELLLKGIDPGKADASAEKAEASLIVESLKPAAKRLEKNQPRERWPEDLAVDANRTKGKSFEVQGTRLLINLTQVETQKLLAFLG